MFSDVGEEARNCNHLHESEQTKSAQSFSDKHTPCSILPGHCIARSNLFSVAVAGLANSGPKVGRKVIPVRENHPAALEL